MAGRPIRRTRSGEYKVDLDEVTRSAIGQLCDELDQLLESDSPLLVRLFPPPYGDDVERNEGYAALAGAELIERRRASLQIVRDTLDATRLSEEQLAAWMRALNDLRLVLGTLLGVERDDEPVQVEAQLADALAAYEGLGALLDAVVDALASGL